MEEYVDVYAYLESNKYPEGLLKDSKRNWRRKCRENFKIENGQLFHRKGDRKAVKEQEQEHGSNEWKLCIKTSEEKERIMRSCHSSVTGKSSHEHSNKQPCTLASLKIISLTNCW